MLLCRNSKTWTWHYILPYFFSWKHVTISAENLNCTCMVSFGSFIFPNNTLKTLRPVRACSLVVQMLSGGITLSRRGRRCSHRSQHGASATAITFAVALGAQRRRGLVPWTTADGSFALLSALLAFVDLFHVLRARPFSWVQHLMCTSNKQ